jgi:hypothetical protein
VSKLPTAKTIVHHRSALKKHRLITRPTGAATVLICTCVFMAFSFPQIELWDKIHLKNKRIKGTDENAT